MKYYNIINFPLVKLPLVCKSIIGLILDDDMVTSTFISKKLKTVVIRFLIIYNRGKTIKVKVPTFFFLPKLPFST